MGSAKVKLLVFLVIVVVGAFFLLRPLQNLVRAKNFSPELLLELGELAGPHPAADRVGRGEPARRGRLIIVAMPRPTQALAHNIHQEPAYLHDAWYKLPGDLQARNPAEAGTLVVVQAVGENFVYSNGREQMMRAQQKMRLAVFSYPEREFLGDLLVVEDEVPPDYFNADDTEAMRIALEEREPLDLLPAILGLPEAE